MERTCILLVSAHFIADFLLQPDWLVQRKDRFGFLLLHGLIHALASYLVFQAWTCWPLPVGVLLAHALIDRAKQWVGKESPRAFAIDQAAHGASLMGLAWVLTRIGWLPAFAGIGYAPIVAFAGFVATIRGAGFFVAKVAERLKEENGLELDGLRNGGALIGYLERALIFLFVFIQEPAGIGFLVAAKSILRFEEAKKQKLAEYVLIGTLLSFSLAIGFASATTWAMGR